VEYCLGYSKCDAGQAGMCLCVAACVGYVPGLRGQFSCDGIG
jgi:hypothetical protein